MNTFFRRISETSNEFIISSLQYIHRNAIDILVIFVLTMLVFSVLTVIILLRISKKVRILQ